MKHKVFWEPTKGTLFHDDRSGEVYREGKHAGNGVPDRSGRHAYENSKLQRIAF